MKYLDYWYFFVDKSLCWYLFNNILDLFEICTMHFGKKWKFVKFYKKKVTKNEDFCDITWIELISFIIIIRNALLVDFDYVYLFFI